MDLLQRLCDVTDVGIDSFANVDLGEPGDPKTFHFLGPHELLPRTGPTIVYTFERSSERSFPGDCLNAFTGMHLCSLTTKLRRI